MHRTCVDHFRFTPVTTGDCISWISIALHSFSLAHGDVVNIRYPAPSRPRDARRTTTVKINQFFERPLSG